MNISLTDLCLVFLFIIVAVHLWNAQGIKQLAHRAVKKHCAEMDVQLLDEGIVLRGFWLKRDARGNVRIWRSYHFEFSSTGDERYQGSIILLGRQVEAIQLQAHRLH